MTYFKHGYPNFKKELFHKDELDGWPQEKINEEINKTMHHEGKEWIHDYLNYLWDLHIAFNTNQ